MGRNGRGLGWATAALLALLAVLFWLPRGRTLAPRRADGTGAPAAGTTD